MGRKATPKRDLAEIFLRQGGKCAVKDCGVKLTVGAYAIDHIHPLALGGEDTLENKQALCVSHHRVKTTGNPATTYGSDLHAITKTRRIERGGKKVRHPMKPGRGFPKTHRPFQRKKPT